MARLTGGGVRLGEVLALKWGDIQFGEETDGGNRFIYVRRNWVDGQFGKPKSGKERRVDLSKQLRRALAELRDKRMLAAYLAGKTSVADELVFPSEAGTPLNGSNVYSRYFVPAIEKAGLRHFRLDDLRHTYASLLIQAGASLAYVQIKSDTAPSRSPWIFTVISCRARMSVGLMAWTARSRRNNPQLPRNKRPKRGATRVLK
jgi:integrase